MSGRTLAVRIEGMVYLHIVYSILSPDEVDMQGPQTWDNFSRFIVFASGQLRHGGHLFQF